jgi:hypothetical protein
MRAYKVKRGRRPSNSYQSNQSSSRAYNEGQEALNPEALEERGSNLGSMVNNSI